MNAALTNFHFSVPITRLIKTVIHSFDNFTHKHTSPLNLSFVKFYLCEREKKENKNQYSSDRF